MDDLYQQLLEFSLRFVSFRPRSEKEIRDFLKKKVNKSGTRNVAVLEDVVTRLRVLGYVDDAKFASWWVEQRGLHKPKGARLIADELKAKGISLEVNTHDDVALAKQAIAKKLFRWQKLPKLEQKKKLYGFLGRRGFDGDTIHRVIDEVVNGQVQ